MMGRENFPAVLIRDDQRQTAIRGFLVGILHPFPLPARRADRCEIVLVELVGDYFEERFFRHSFCGRALDLLGF